MAKIDALLSIFELGFLDEKEPMPVRAIVAHSLVDSQSENSIGNCLTPAIV